MTKKYTIRLVDSDDECFNISDEEDIDPFENKHLVSIDSYNRPIIYRFWMAGDRIAYYYETHPEYTREYLAQNPQILQDIRRKS